MMRAAPSKRGGAVVAAIAAMLLPAMAQAAGATTAVDQAWLAEHRVIRVGLETDYPPFSYLGPDGQPAGISVEYLRLLGQRLGIRFEFPATGPLSVLLDEARHGELDLLTSLARTPEREAYLAFTRPYFSSPAVLVVRRDHRGPDRLEAMGGARIAVGRGFAVEEHLRRQHPALQLVEAPDDDAVLRLLLSDDADGAVVDLASLSWILSNTGVEGLRLQGEVGFSYQLSLATRGDLPQLRRLLDDGLQAVGPDDARRIRDQWIHLDVASQRGAAALWQWLALSAASLALLGLVAFGVNRALRREVERRTAELATAMAALERTQRALRMLTACSEAILRATGEQDLYADVCRAIVETGGYRMCWVGIAEVDARRTVRPVAYAGHEDGYLHRIDLVWADAPGGQRPTGTAIREGRCVVGQDFATTPSLIPWQEEALRRGYRASSALPLSCEGERIGALMMYSSAVSSFSEAELGILRQLADDLAFGAHALRQRAAKARADAGRENAFAGPLPGAGAVQGADRELLRSDPGPGRAGERHLRQPILPGGAGALPRRAGGAARPRPPSPGRPATRRRAVHRRPWYHEAERGLRERPLGRGPGDAVPDPPSQGRRPRAQPGPAPGRVRPGQRDHPGGGGRAEGAGDGGAVAARGWLPRAGGPPAPRRPPGWCGRSPGRST